MIHYDTACLIGAKRPDWEDSEDAFDATIIDRDTAVFTVVDAHRARSVPNMEAARYARVACSTLHDQVVAHPSRDSLDRHVDYTSRFLDELFGEVLMGACAAVLIVKGSTYVLAYLGDVVLWGLHPERSALSRTRDHDLNDSVELQRVERVIECRSDFRIDTDAGRYPAKSRISRRGSDNSWGPGINVTRAFGDWSYRPVVSQTADIVSGILPVNGSLALCTDGAAGYAKLALESQSRFLGTGQTERRCATIVQRAFQAKPPRDDATCIFVTRR